MSSKLSWISRLASAAVLISMSLAPALPQQLPPGVGVTVYESPTCGCCGKWAGYLQENGFKVEIINMSYSELDAVHAKYGVPSSLRQCHIAIVQDYVIEGHVPVDAIRRLLKEKPTVVGLVVQGMPIGSPGMEGLISEHYDVLTFDRQGRVSVYARK